MTKKPFIRQPRLLTEDVLQQLENLIGIGCTVETACASIGINKQSFYNWQHASEDWCALGDADPLRPVMLDTVPILTFSTRLARAQARAHVLATAAVRSAFVEHSTTEMEPYTYRETRLRRGKEGEEIPYVYEETRLRQIEHVTLPDWRAGLEFLRRRDPAAWNPPQKFEISFEEKAVAYIQAGEVEFWDFVSAYDYELAADLFARAGKDIPPREAHHASSEGKRAV